MLKTKHFKINMIAKDPSLEAVAESQAYYDLPYMCSCQVQDECNLAEDSPYIIGLFQADQLRQGSSPVKVCIVDTGYGLGHPGLPNSSHGINGYSPYIGTDKHWDIDGHSHGTHCAGTIGAIGSNGTGVTSVNPDPNKFTFFIAKGLTNSGTGTTVGIIAAIKICVEMGDKVISMILGCDGCDNAVEEAVMKVAYNEPG
jgi:subtilisin family serine protease